MSNFSFHISCWPRLYVPSLLNANLIGQIPFNLLTHSVPHKVHQTQRCCYKSHFEFKKMLYQRIAASILIFQDNASYGTVSILINHLHAYSYFCLTLLSHNDILRRVELCADRDEHSEQQSM